MLFFGMLFVYGNKVVKARRSMTHAEVVIARRAVEEGRGLVVIVNKMDLLKGKRNSTLFDKVMEAVPLEIQTVIPQVCLIIFCCHCYFIQLYPGGVILGDFTQCMHTHTHTHTSETDYQFSFI
jgi:hypothetical protein